MKSMTKLLKVVPKGAQRKFSAQKLFLRECRAKYHRNIRRRSSKDVPKGMQNLYLLLALIHMITFTLYCCLSAGCWCRRLITRSTFRRLLKLLCLPACIGLRNISIIFAKKENCNKELNSTVYICPYHVIYFYLSIHVQISLLWPKLVYFEPKAKNTFPSFRTQRSMSLHKMRMFRTKLLRVHRTLSPKPEYFCSCFML